MTEIERGLGLTDVLASLRANKWFLEMEHRVAVLDVRMSRIARFARNNIEASSPDVLVTHGPRLGLKPTDIVRNAQRADRWASAFSRTMLDRSTLGLRIAGEVYARLAK